MSIILKVGFPPGTVGVKFKAIKLRSTVSAKDVIEEILKSASPQFSNQNPSEYVLYIPPNGRIQSAIWVDDSKTLSQFPLQEKDIIEIKTKYQVLHVKYHRSKQRILINVNEPLKTSLPLIAKKFQLDNISDFGIVVKKQLLDLNKSVREHSLSTDQPFFLKHNSEQIEDIEEEQDAPVEVAAPSEQVVVAAPIEVVDLQAAAKDIKNPRAAANLPWKASRKKKYEPRWMVLKDNFLFQYKSQTDKKPQAVLDIKKTKRQIVIEGEDKKKEYQIEFVHESEPWMLKFESEGSLKIWMDHFEQSQGIGVTKVKRVFGVPLVNVVKPGHKIPDIVEQCIKYIDEKALDVVGIFRLSGSSVRIDEYQQAFDKGEHVDLSAESDPHCVSGLLKSYFRELPEPILTFGLYDRFIAAQSIPDTNLRLRYVKNLLETLPKINHELLKYLMDFLRRVQAYSAQNKMAIHNLATVFGPNLLVPPDRSTFQMIQDTPFINGITASMISDYEYYFTDKTADQYAVALYDFNGENETELSFKQNDKILVIIKGDDNGWWTGQINSRIGRFPGSYVKLEIKSKKQQFIDEMNSVKTKLQEEKAAIEKLQQSKQLLEEEISQVKKDSDDFNEEIKQLKKKMIKVLQDNKLDSFLPKYEKYYVKLSVALQTKQKFDECSKPLLTDLDELKQFLAQPADKTKTKPKSQEKIDSLLGIALMKFNAELKKRQQVDEAMDDLFKDCSSLIELLRAKE